MQIKHGMEAVLFAAAESAATNHVGVEAISSLSAEGFFLAFFSALRSKGLRFIDVRSDIHYRRFDRVVSELLQDERSATLMPIELYPSPFDGRYRELDDALLSLQKGAMGARNPTYPGVQILISPKHAEEELHSLGTEGREFINHLADRYISASRDS